MKSPAPRGPSASAVPEFKSREETVWSQVYLAWILDGSVDQSLGEYRVWKVSDERDLDAERRAFEADETNWNKDAGRLNQQSGGVAPAKL